MGGREFESPTVHMQRIALVLILFLFSLSMVETASGHYSSAFPKRHFGRHIASQYWGGQPPCGKPTIKMYEFGNRYVGYANSVTCEIIVDRHHSRSYICDIVAHEWGHLKGFPHSNNPNNVMYPVIKHILPACT